MDRIASDAWRRKWVDDIGHKQVILRGRGGTGKTIALLQLAHHAFQRHNKRSLLITYNLTLVADLKRLLLLSGIPDELGVGGIKIWTIHKLLYRLAKDMGIDTYRFLDRFEQIKDEIIGHIDNELFTSNDFQELRLGNREIYDFDIIFIDEGQDWPDDEIKIFRWMFGLKNIVIADGVDQIVRKNLAQGKKFGWDRNLDSNQYIRRYLRKGVRMKSNLAYFMADVAWECFGLDNWDVDPNDDATGGRVIVYEGDLISKPDVFRKLCSEARQEGNYPIDMLACVPPPMVQGGVSQVSAAWEQSGIRCWDACSSEVRKNPPVSSDQLRIVQYQSCRGLEGWTVINFCFDEFWEIKHEEGCKSALEQREDSLDLEENARQYAGKWLMIPLSRAIDTLVINVSLKDSEIKRKIRGIYEKKSHDCFEWRSFS